MSGGTITGNAEFDVGINGGAIGTFNQSGGSVNLNFPLLCLL